MILYWIKSENEVKFAKSGIAYKSFTLLLLLFSIIFAFPKESDFWGCSYDMSQENAQNLLRKIPKGSTVYLFLEGAQYLVEDMKNDYNLVTLYAKKIPSFEAYKNIYQDKFITPDKIAANDENSYYIAAWGYINYYLPNLPDYDIEIFDHQSFKNDQYFVYKLK